MTEGSKRIAFVTGANKGIGFEVARSLGKASLTVLVGGRNRELGEAGTATLKAEGIDARYVEVDVVRRATIEAAAAMITAEFQRLDVLINNAGINDSGDGPPSAADLGAVRRVIETNFLGAVAVTQAMLPLLRKSAAGRIVNVSSGLGSQLERRSELGIRGGQTDWVLRVKGCAEHADHPARVRIARNDDQGERVESRLHGDRSEWAPRIPDGRPRSGGDHTPSVVARRWSNGRVL